MASTATVRRDHGEAGWGPPPNGPAMVRRGLPPQGGGRSERRHRHRGLGLRAADRLTPPPAGDRGGGRGRHPARSGGRVAGPIRPGSGIFFVAECKTPDRFQLARLPPHGPPGAFAPPWRRSGSPTSTPTSRPRAPTSDVRETRGGGSGADRRGGVWAPRVESHICVVVPRSRGPPEISHRGMTHLSVPSLVQTHSSNPPIGVACGPHPPPLRGQRVPRRCPLPPPRRGPGPRRTCCPPWPRRTSSSSPAPTPMGPLRRRFFRSLIPQPWPTTRPLRATPATVHPMATREQRKTKGPVLMSRPHINETS